MMLMIKENEYHKEEDDVVVIERVIRYLQEWNDAKAVLLKEGVHPLTRNRIVDELRVTSKAIRILRGVAW